jgi:hypothetical protein
MKPTTTGLSRKPPLDEWPVATAGLNIHVVHCLDKSRVQTIGQLRSYYPDRLSTLKNFGRSARQNVVWFFDWIARVETGAGLPDNLPALLREFLNESELLVIENRFGLTDPLYRPQMRPVTLREIGTERGGLTRERVRQVQDEALQILGTQLCRAVGEPLRHRYLARLKSQGGIVSVPELAAWAGDPMLGGYQPWGALLLWSALSAGIQFRHNFFTTLPVETLDRLEARVLKLLETAPAPLAAEEFTGRLPIPDANRRRILSLLLEQHPAVCATKQQRYFLPGVGDKAVVVEVLRAAGRALHFEELTSRYNDQVLAHSQKSVRDILNLIPGIPAVERIAAGVYRLR